MYFPTLISIIFSSTIFVFNVVKLKQKLQMAIQTIKIYGLVSIILALDSISAIIFARLRKKIKQLNLL